MAMLAERKRKVKWALNPRGKLWSDDSSKFGQKILEKMGWSSGKGLGVDECGITEHIKVSFKNDSQGIGYKDRGDQWTQHEDQFNSLLSSLNDGNEKIEKLEEPIVCTGFGFKDDKDEKPTPAIKELSGESLEEKSKKSKARVHYKKFTRGKDISKYSEKDLANIFGKKVKDEPVEARRDTVLNYGIVQPQNQLKSESDIIEEKDSNFGITTIESKLSMADYFKSKMPNLGKSKKYAVGPDGVLVSIKTEGDHGQEDNYRACFQQDIVKEEVEHETPKLEEQLHNKSVNLYLNDIDNRGTDLHESEQLDVPKKKKKAKKNKSLKELFEKKPKGIENNVINQDNGADAPEQNISKNKKNKSKNVNPTYDELQVNIENRNDSVTCKQNKNVDELSEIRLNDIGNIPEEERADLQPGQDTFKKKKKSKKQNKTTNKLNEIENDSKKSELVENKKSTLDNIPSEQLNEDIDIPKIKKKEGKSKVIKDIVMKQCNGESNEDLKLSRITKNKRKREVIEENIENPKEAKIEIVNNDGKSDNDAATSEPKKKKHRKNKKSAEKEHEAKDNVVSREENIEITEKSEKAEIKKENKRKRKQENESNKEKTENVDAIEDNANGAAAKKNNDSQKKEMKNNDTKKRFNRKDARTVNNRRNVNSANPGHNIKGKILNEYYKKGNEFLLQDAFSGSNFLKLSGYGKVKTETKSATT